MLSFNERDLLERTHLFGWVDAIVLNVREILDLRVDNKKSYTNWHEFFGWFNQWQLRGADLVVSDSLAEFVQAVQTKFIGYTCQRCQTPFTRNILDQTPKVRMSKSQQQVREIVTAPDEETARTLLNRMLEAME